MQQNTKYEEEISFIESSLYSALEALEKGDLIGVRQGSIRAHEACISAWRMQKKDKDHE